MEIIEAIPELLPVVLPSLTAMSSKEIAALVRSQPSSVNRTIRRLVDRGTIEVPRAVESVNHLGQTVTDYLINRRDTYVVVAQLSPEFTARLVDRWAELERVVNPVRVQTPFRVRDLSISDTSDLMSAMIEHEPGQLLEFMGNNLGSLVESLVTAKLSELQNQLIPTVRVNQVVENPNEILTLTQLGYSVRLTPQRLNRVLCDLGLQTRDEYGEYNPSLRAEGLYEIVKRSRTREGILVTRIKWKRKVLDLLPSRYHS